MGLEYGHADDHCMSQLNYYFMPFTLQWQTGTIFNYLITESEVVAVLTDR